MKLGRWGENWGLAIEGRNGCGIMGRRRKWERLLKRERADNHGPSTRPSPSPSFPQHPVELKIN